MSMTSMTTIKVTKEARDLVKAGAVAHGMTQSAYIEHVVRELRRHEILDELATWEPDEEYLAEWREWDRADLGTILG